MFRQEAIEYQKTKWKGKAMLLPGTPFWLVAVLSFSLTAAFIVFITVGTYTRRINVTGEISTYPRAAYVYSSVQGVVVKQFVTEGDKVDVGSPIYKIDVSKSTPSGVVSDNQRQHIDNQLERINKIISQLENSKKNTIAMLEKQISHYAEALKNSKDIFEKAREGVLIMKGNMESYRDYQAKGLVNKDQLINQVSLYYQQQNNLLGLSGQNEQNALQLTLLESQVQIQAADFDSRVYQMELQRYDLHKERLQIDSNGEIIIRALSDGYVNSLSVTVGQMVNVGDSLLQILPSNIDYYSLIVWVPNDAIPYISVGDPVNIRYEAFPSAKFGKFTGTVSLISKVPASPEEMHTYQGAPRSIISMPQPYYKLVVRPKKNQINYGEKMLRLENGMKAQSTFFLEKRKIYQWMISPLYDIKNSANGPEHE